MNRIVCAFGQACYTRFGHSVMRDIINAGFDPHYWFAGITKGIIDADLSRIDDRDWVDATSKFLKENVTKAERQGAKCGNFGLPGGLQDASFYKYCRVNGASVTYDEAVNIRHTWMETFTEIDEHLKAELMPRNTPMVRGFGADATEDGVDAYDDEKGNLIYRAQTITGMVRNRCSRTSAANLQFQSTRLK